MSVSPDAFYDLNNPHDEPDNGFWEEKMGNDMSEYDDDQDQMDWDHRGHEW